MKNKIIYLVLVVLVSGCANFNFVYNDSFLKSPLVNSTKLDVQGDDKENASIYLKETIGDVSGSTYNLKINISKTTNTTKVDIDSTASKIEISHSTKYELIKNDKNCKIYEEIIVTSSNYNSKSEGYNFGTDTSIKVVVDNNIKASINKFFIKLRNTNPNLECFDAD